MASGVPLVELLSSSSDDEEGDLCGGEAARGKDAARGDAAREVAELSAQLASAEAAAAAAHARARAAQRDAQAAEASAAELRTALARAESAAAQEAPDYAEGDFTWSASAQRALSSVFGLRQFRGWQRAAVNATLAGRDVFLVAPSGGGKSLCYQLPALVDDAAARQAVTLVVCPLVSLMQDQVSQLAARGMRAFALSAATPREEQTICYRAMSGESDKASAEQRDTRPMLVYVTPERLEKSKRVIGALQKAHSQRRLARIAVDEAHCLSAWGHDYRPDYLKLSKLRELYPNTPILAATATATPRVVKDSVNRLRMHGALVFRHSIDRREIAYAVVRKQADADEFASGLSAFIKTQASAGIVYACSQAETEGLAGKLQSRGVVAEAYHGGMSEHERNAAYMRWVTHKTQCVVATVAFGLGINKADVRWVVHATLSKALLAYYQESGRAGRDGKPARAILCYRPSDVARWSPLVMSSGQIDEECASALENLYSCARYARGGCRRAALLRHFNEADAIGRLCGGENCCDVCDKGTHKCAAAPACDSSLVADALAVIAEAAQGEKARPLTINMAADRLGRKATGKQLSKPARECLFVDLLLAGALRETFSATSFSINAYLGLSRAGGAAVREHAELAALARRVPCPSSFVASPTLTDLAAVTSKPGGSNGAQPACKKQRTLGGTVEAVPPLR